MPICGFILLVYVYILKIKILLKLAAMFKNSVNIFLNKKEKFL